MSNLFETVFGAAAFARLPRTVQRLHADTGARRYRGQGRVVRGTHPLARLCCAAARLPAPYEGAMAVDMRSTPTEETWVRRFGQHAMPSRLRRDDGHVSERLGLLHFLFGLDVCERDASDGRVLRWSVRRVSVLAVPLPLRWFAGVAADEFERDGRYRYEVDARLPWIGRLVRYEGWLDVDAPEWLT